MLANIECQVKRDFKNIVFFQNYTRSLHLALPNVHQTCILTQYTMGGKNKFEEALLANPYFGQNTPQS